VSYPALELRQDGPHLFDGLLQASSWFCLASGDGSRSDGVLDRRQTGGIPFSLFGEQRPVIYTQPHNAAGHRQSTAPV
jgi:hypothetical protein